MRAHRVVKVYVGLNIPRHRDVKLNELPKQILMLLPLLLLLLLLLYVLHHVLIRGREAPPYNYVVRKYIQQKQQQKQQRQQHPNLFWQFIQLNIAVPGNVICQPP